MQKAAFPRNMKRYAYFQQIMLTSLLVTVWLTIGYSKEWKEVTIIRSPKHGLVLFGQPLFLRCLSASQPSGGLWYMWRTAVQDISGSLSMNDSLSISSTLQLIIHEDFPPLFRIFCYVFAHENNSALGMGKIDIEVGGLMMSNSASGLYPQGVRLFVNRTQDFSTRQLLKGVMPYVDWKYSATSTGGSDNFLNAVIIEKNKFISQGSSVLTITNPSVMDSGVYVADIVSLLTETNSCGLNGSEVPSCDDLTLPLLTHSAVTRPVAFNLVVQRGDLQPRVMSITSVKGTPDFLFYLRQTGIWIEQFKVPLIHHSSLNFTTSTLIFKLYFNGIDLGSVLETNEDFYNRNEDLSSISYRYWLATTSSGTQEAIVMVSLSEPKPSHVGIYEVIFKIPAYKSRCCPEHRNLLLGVDGMSLQYYVVGLATMELRKPKHPSLSVSTDRRNFTKQESASLTCNLNSINGPNLDTFKWQKNGETIVSFKNPKMPLTLLTTSVKNPFGVFECVANNGYISVNKVVLISEKVLIIYILRPINNSGGCDINRRDEVKLFMTNEIHAILTILCNCELSPSNLFDKSVTCDPKDRAITFQMSFAFANMDGSLTASSLAMEAEQWIVGEKNVNGTFFTTQVPTSSNITNTTQIKKALNLTITKLALMVLGCVVAGVAIGTVLTCLMLRFVSVMKKFKCKSCIWITSTTNEVLVLESHQLPLAVPSRHFPTNNDPTAQEASHSDAQREHFEDAVQHAFPVNNQRESCEDLGGEGRTITDTIIGIVSEVNGFRDNLNSSHMPQQQSVLNCNANPAYTKINTLNEMERREEGLEQSQQHSQAGMVYDYPRNISPQPYQNPGSLMEVSRASPSDEVAHMPQMDTGSYEN